MTDFVQMGTIMGARRAIAEVVADGEEALAHKDRQISEHRAALAVEQAHAAGLQAQVDLLLAELRRAVPQSGILRATGRKFSDGRAETVVGKTYVTAFDQKALSLGIRNPEAHREKVK